MAAVGLPGFGLAGLRRQLAASQSGPASAHPHRAAYIYRYAAAAHGHTGTAGHQYAGGYQHPTAHRYAGADQHPGSYGYAGAHQSAAYQSAAQTGSGSRRARAHGHARARAGFAGGYAGFARCHSYTCRYGGA